jgi:hypothetical protein
MYTIDHAEEGLRQCGQDEKTLQKYSVAVLEELCTNNGIEVDKGSSSRRLKKPYIKAVLGYVRRHSSLLITNIDSQASRIKRVTEMQDIQD